MLGRKDRNSYINVYVSFCIHVSTGLNVQNMHAQGVWSFVLRESVSMEISKGYKTNIPPL